MIGEGFKKHLVQGLVGSAMVGGMYLNLSNQTLDDVFAPSEKSKEQLQKTASATSELNEVKMQREKQRRRLQKKSSLRNLDRALSSSIAIGAGARAPASVGGAYAGGDPAAAFASAVESSVASGANLAPSFQPPPPPVEPPAPPRRPPPPNQARYDDVYDRAPASAGSALSGGGSTVKPSCLNCEAQASAKYEEHTPPTPESTVPSILSVTTKTLDGNYHPGDLGIAIDVKFFEPVVVNGNATLELETGIEDTLVPLSEGSGTNTLSFYYIIKNGDFATDLTYKSNKSLVVLGGGIFAADDGTEADINLPLLSSVNSLIQQKNINIVDNVPPKLKEVNSQEDDAITYGEDSNLVIEVEFDEIVTVTGLPQLNLNSGGTAIYTGGSGSRKLIFQYTVVAGQNSNDLAVTSFNLGGGTITDPSGNPADLVTFPTGLMLNDFKDLIVDTTFPTILNINSTNSNTIPYKESTTIDIQVNFSENVYLSGTGYPTLSLNNGKTATYVSGDTTAQLNFQYSVDPGDDIGVLDVTSFNLLTSLLKDDLNNNADISLPVAPNNLATNKPLEIDTIDPIITNMNVSPFPAVDNYLGIGESVTILVDFSENIYTLGIQTLAMNSGGLATVTGGSGTTQLSFTYTVLVGESVVDLDAIAMTVGGFVRDIAGNDANLAVPANGGAIDRISEYNNIEVDTTLPSITSIVKSPATNLNKKIGDSSTYVVNFSEPVFITPTPQLNIDSGATLNMVSSTATSMTFNYTVVEGENSNDLTAVSVLAGGGIVDIAGNNADLTLPTGQNIADSVDVVVDGTRPVITNITSPTGSGFYTVGNDVDINVKFSEPVNITGVERLALNSGAGVYALYEAGNGSDEITFRYTVSVGHGAADLAVTSFDLNGGSLKDFFNNDGYTTLPAVGGANDLLQENHDIKIDTGAPYIASIDSSVTDGTFIIGDTIDIRVNFNEDVAVTGGPPTLSMDSGGTATFVNVTGSTANFTYTILPGEISADLNVVLMNSNGAIVRDLSTNVATTAMPANNLAVIKNIYIEGGVPTITDITTSEADGYYSIFNPNFIVEVVFSEPVFVSGGIPRLQLNVGASRYAQYNGVGDGTNTLQFAYTINTGDNTLDLDYVGTSLDLQGATIKDASGNNITNSFPAPGTANWFGSDHNVIVDTAPPIDAPANPQFLDSIDGDGNEIALNWSDFTDSSGIVNHQLYLFTDSNCLNPSAAGIDAGKTLSSVANDNGILDGLANGTYWVKVMAYDIVGNTTLSACSSDSIIVDYSPPQVLEVRSKFKPNPDTYTYYVGETFDIEVVWTEPVAISGSTVCLNMNISGGKQACYFTGTGTNKIIFRYTVQPGDNSADLDYMNTTALSLAGGYIRDLVNTEANLTLPVPGLTGSLSFNDNIVVDTLGPQINAVHVTETDGITTKPDGTYTVGEQMSVIVEFHEPIKIGSPLPQLELNSSRVIDCIIHPGNSSALKCDYTVTDGDNSARLDVASVNALSPGGLFEDNYFNTANLTLVTPGAANSISDDQNIIINSNPAFDGPVHAFIFSRKHAGKIYAVGEFTKYGLDVSPGIARLNADLSFDNTFNAAAGFTDYIPSNGRNGVLTIAEAIDGSGDLYVGGTFSKYQGATHNRIVRLNDDGSIDSGFVDGTGFDDYVTRIRAVDDSSGDILVSGKFTEYQGINIASNKLIKLNSNGSVDNSFNVGNTFGSGLSEEVSDFQFEEDVYGKILVASSKSGAELKRLTVTGSVDSTFTPAAIPSNPMMNFMFDPQNKTDVLALGSGDAGGMEKLVRYEQSGTYSAIIPAVGTLFDDTIQAGQWAFDGSGKFYVGGNFTDVGGVSLNRVARINANGSADASFNTIIGSGASGGEITTLSQDPYGTGRVYIAGDFTAFNSDEGRRYFTALETVSSGTSPYITNVNSSGGDTTYTVDDIVPIELTFSENITLAGGSAKLRVNVGVRYDEADCSSVSSGNTLVCQYVVKVGDTNSDFDVSSELSLYLPSGVSLTQSAAPNNPATLRVPFPGLATSLSSNRNIVIDGALVFDGEVHAVAFVNDGSGDLYVGGSFSQYHGVSKNGIVRLNSDLSIDSSFNVGTGFDGAVYDIAVMADGSGLVVVGNFQNYQGTTARKIIKLTHAGAREATFEGNRPNCDLSALRPLRSVVEALDGSGNLFIGGTLQDCSGNLSALFKLDKDGNDIGFSNMLTQGFFHLNGGDAPDVRDIIIDPQGTNDLFVSVSGGSGYPGPTIRFSEVGGNFDFNWVTRITKDGEYVGALNGNESPQSAPYVLGASLRDDGELFMGGNFAGFDSVGIPTNMASLFSVVDSSGNLSSTFNQTSATTFAGASAQINAIAAASDGSGDIFVGGKFTSYKGSAQAGLVRVKRDGTNSNTSAIGAGLDNSNSDWINTIAVNEDSNGVAAVGGSLTLLNGRIVSNIALIDSRVDKNSPSPTIARVHSPDSGTITTGTVTIYVEFSEGVIFNTAGGTPYILLNLDGMAVKAFYTGMLNATTAIFDFTINPGDNTPDLNYVNKYSFNPNGGSIVSSSTGNVAIATLPRVNGPNSLAGQENIGIDTTALITNVTSTNANGEYVFGDSIMIQITFDQNVFVNSGTPTLDMGTGLTVGVANYVSGSGTKVLNFQYVVGIDEHSDDLDYRSTTALTGDIVNSVGSSADLTLPALGGAGSLAFNKDLDVYVRSFIRQMGASTAALESALVSALGDDEPKRSNGSFNDINNNLLVAGTTTGNFAETNGGNSDVFVMRFNRSGKVGWAKQMGATTIDGTLGGDSSGTEEITSYCVTPYQNKIIIPMRVSGSYFETNAGSNDISVMQLDTNGTIDWYKQYGTVTSAANSMNASGNDVLRGCTLDPGGNVFLTGHTSGSLISAHGGNNDNFMLKLSNTGSQLASYQFGSSEGGASAGDDELFFASYSNNKVYALGRAPASTDFIEQIGGSQDIFTARFTSASLTYDWYMHYGNTTGGASISAKDHPHGIVSDSSGNVYIGGYTEGNFGENNAGGEDAFVAKIDNTSGAIIWKKQLGQITLGAAATGNDKIQNVAIDSVNNILYGFGDTTSSMAEPNAGGSDFFVAAFDMSTGSLLWIKQIGTTTATALGLDASGNEEGRSVFVENATQAIYMVGQTDGSLSEPNGGSRDIVIMKMKSDGTFNP